MNPSTPELIARTIAVALGGGIPSSGARPLASRHRPSDRAARRRHPTRTRSG